MQGQTVDFNLLNDNIPDLRGKKYTQAIDYIIRNADTINLLYGDEQISVTKSSKDPNGVLIFVLKAGKPFKIFMVKIIGNDVFLYERVGEGYRIIGQSVPVRSNYSDLIVNFQRLVRQAISTIHSSSPTMALTHIGTTEILTTTLSLLGTINRKILLSLAYTMETQDNSFAGLDDELINLMTNALNSV